MATPLVLDAAGISRRGRNAFGNNDDRSLVDVARRLFIVADARGPSYGGYHAPLGADVALATITESLAPESLRAAFESANTTIHALHRAYQEAFTARLRSTTDRLRASLDACRQVARERLGLTIDSFAHFCLSLTALHFGDHSVTVAQIGTCRAYRKRGERVELLVADHALATILRAQGKREEAACHPGVATRMLGANPTAAVDVLELAVEPGDRYALCSDGMWDALDDRALRRALDCSDAATGALALAEAACGDDDATTAVILANEG